MKMQLSLMSRRDMMLNTVRAVAVFTLSTTTGAIAAPYVIASTALGGRGRPPSKERIALGFIGVGTANLTEPGCAIKIIEGIKNYCVRNNIAKIKELTGTLQD